MIGKSKQTDKNYIIYSFLAITVLIGSYFRLKGLGKWPLALDEFYIIRSVQNIFKYGLPQFDAGGYYPRGILYQYLIAALWSAGLKAEFAGRIIPVVTNLLAFPALYKLGKKISGKTLATVLVVFFSFSLWEVEFARFARMYSPFQTIFIWYLYNFYLLLFENKKSAFNWMLGLSFISIFVYEASIFLVIMNFLPFLWDFENKKFTFPSFNKIFREINFGKLVIAGIIFIAAYFYLSFDFRTYNQTNLLPPELKDYFANLPQQSKFRLPMVLMFSLPNGTIWKILNILPVAIILFIALKIVKTKDFSLENKISIIIILIFSLLNLYGMAIVFGIMFAMMGWLNFKNLNKKIIYPVIAVIGFTFVYWSFYALFNTSWHQYLPKGKFEGTLVNLKILWKQFLNYPNFYEMFVIFRNVLPKLTYTGILLLVAGVIVLLLKTRNNTKKYKFFCFVFILLLFLITFINTLYFETRYFFFVYPLYLILVLGNLELIINEFIKNHKSKLITFVIGSFLILIISEDIQFRHLINIDSPEVNFRVGYSYAEKSHYYPRWDARTPSQIVNKEARGNDMILTNDEICDFYLNRLDYLYENYKSRDFQIESVQNGTKERWTNSNLIYTYDDLLLKLFSSPGTKWLIINTMWGVRDLERAGFFEKIHPYLYFKCIDNLTFLYKITIPEKQ